MQARHKEATGRPPPRLGAVALRVAGMDSQRAFPEAELVNHLLRVTRPAVRYG